MDISEFLDGEQVAKVGEQLASFLFQLFGARRRNNLKIGTCFALA